MFSITVQCVCVLWLILSAVGSDDSAQSAFAEVTPSAQIDFQMIMNICNSSFSIPMEYITEFNNTGVLPDETDKTGMCYIRCVFEKSGLINDWKLNREMLQQTMWPATGDSVEVCQQQGKSETCACTRMYAIAKCLMIRAIVDARDKQVV